jgi:hypothetical protein
VTGPPLTVVACGAPLASRAPDVRAALRAVGWSAALLVSEAATAWAGEGDGSRPRPDVVVACPLTFNTANKVVAGVMDTPAAGTLCDALGAGLRIVAVPMVNTRLWAHPTWATTIRTLTRWGVTLLDPSDGRAGAPQPVASGSGEAVTNAFDPGWVVAAVGPAAWCG